MKICKIILIIVFSIALIGCKDTSADKMANQTPLDFEDEPINIDTQTDPKKEIENYKRDTRPGEVVNISLEQVEEMIKSKETFVISFETSYCMYCRQLHIILDEYLKKHHVIIYQVILDNENRTEEENLQIIHKYFDEFYTTPGVFYVKEGKNTSYLDTYTLGIEESVLDQWIKENQIDKEK